MRETKIMQFDWYTGNGTHDFEVELRERILNREDEVKIIPNKIHENFYDIFLILKREK